MSERRIDVTVIVPPRALLLDIAGPIEVLRRANVEQHDVRFDVRYAGAAAAVASSIGLTLSGIDAFPESPADGAMIVVPGNADNIAFGEDPSDASVERDEAAIVAWLARVVRPSHTLVTICSGALLAARAGLLDGHDCTTHFSVCGALATLAPRARVLDNRLYVANGNRCSIAGVTAGIDLMLHLVAQLCSAAVALAVARHLVVYLRRSGSDPQLSPWLEGRNHIHPAVHRAQDAITADPSRMWTLAALARIANTSPRHLSRLFNEHAAMSITDYINRARIALAGDIMAGSRLDMESVAERAGFSSARQFRRAWRRLHDAPPSRMRGG